MAALNHALLANLLKKKSGGPTAKASAGASKAFAPLKKKPTGGPSKPFAKVPVISKEGEQLSSQQAASLGKEVTVSDIIKYLDTDPSKDFIIPNQEAGSGAPRNLGNPPTSLTDSSLKRRTTQPKKVTTKKVTCEGADAPAGTTKSLKGTPQSPTDKSTPGTFIMQIERVGLG